MWVHLHGISVYLKALNPHWGKYQDSKGQVRFQGTAGLSESKTHGLIIVVPYVASDTLDVYILRRFISMTLLIYILDLNVHMYWPLPQLSSDPGPIRLVLPHAWSTATSSTWTVAQGGGISVSNLGSYEQGELSQFQSMNNNDKWKDGDLLDVLDYLMKSKRVRTLAIESYCQRHWFFAMRIV